MARFVAMWIPVGPCFLFEADPVSIFASCQNSPAICNTANWF